MTRNEIICNLKELLKDATSHLNYSVQRDGTPDEVYMRDVVSLTAAIQALVTQGAAKPEQPKSREGELLDRILAVITDEVYATGRPMFDAVVQLWRDGKRAESQFERAALSEYRRKCEWRAAPENLGRSKIEVGARIVLLMLGDLQQGDDKAERKE